MSSETNHKPATNKVPTPAPEQSTPSPVIETPTPTPTQPVKSSKKLLIIGVSIISALLMLGVGTVSGIFVAKQLTPQNNTFISGATDGNTPVSNEERSIATVAEKVSPSVVSIITETRTNSYYGDNSGAAAGTGIIVSKDGYVLTNNHVLESATSVSVVDSNGELYKDVKIIGRDPLNDIAFLKISGKNDFSPATLGDSSTIRTGQQVVAIGNALGQYSNTVTSGIISGTGRPITAGSEGGATETLTDLIQTDASINPGNSGGPLVNMSGQIIGLNTAIVEDANGIGFAIPINATKGTLAGVLETGKVSRSYLGVNYLTVTPDVAREYDLSVNYGAYVFASDSTNPVVSGSPADKAGLKNGDILVKINDDTIGKQGSLLSILGEHRAGDQLTVTYVRDGKEQTTQVTLGTYDR
jgi:serine protease Do